MATGDTRENKDIPPGTKVNCITCFDEKIEGEVLAFDYNSKFIVISILFCMDFFEIVVFDGDNILIFPKIF